LPAAVVVPIASPIFLTQVSPSGGDATLLFRVVILLSNAFFDAVAPYHPTAVGVYSRLPRQPAPPAGDNTAPNTALLYATLRVMNWALPQSEATWRQMLCATGLDPDVTTTDPSTPAGVGNAAGAAIVAGRRSDGMNDRGDLGGRTYNKLPFADYTGYVPRNSPYKLTNAARWQPAITRLDFGVYKVQTFVTPQYALVEPYAIKNLKTYRFPPPSASVRPWSKAYKAQANAVLAATAALTDEKKAAIEFWDSKLTSLGRLATGLAAFRGASLFDSIAFGFAVNLAGFDSGALLCWRAPTASRRALLRLVTRSCVWCSRLQPPPPPSTPDRPARGRSC
jgi:hypothetical protein